MKIRLLGTSCFDSCNTETSQILYNFLKKREKSTRIKLDCKRKLNRFAKPKPPNIQPEIERELAATLSAISSEQGARGGSGGRRGMKLKI